MCFNGDNTMTAGTRLIPAIGALALATIGTDALAQDACGATGGTFTIPFAVDPADLTPGANAKFPPSLIFDQIYDTLLRHSPDGLKPGLAASWNVADDNLSITLTLRDGVRFHHGATLTADDVVYSLERLRDPEFKSPWASQLKLVDKIEATDPLTVKITLTEPFAPILSVLATPWYSAISSKEFAPGKNANEAASGTGPFKLVEYIPNDHVTLEKNPEYWEPGFPCYDGLTYQIVPELQAQISAFRQGNADIVAVNDPKFIPLLKDKPGVVFMPPPGPVNESGLALNNAEGPTSDVRVRRALSLGIDRQAMIDTVLFGYGEVGTKIPCGEAPYGWCQAKDEPLPYYEYDPEKAKALLAEAGFPDGLELTVQANLPLDVQTAEILVEQWKAIGVTLKIEQTPDLSTHIDNFINVKHQLSILTLVWQPDPDPNVYPIYHSTSKINLGKFSDPALDKLLDTGRTELDPEKRVTIYREVQSIVAENAYMLYPFTKPVNWQFTNDKVKGYTPQANGSFYNLRYSWTEK